MPFTRNTLNRVTILLTIVVASGSAPAAPAAKIEPLVAGNTAFALDLYGQLKAGPGNLFFSPYSISTALAMTHAGARGETEKQMARVLHLGADPRPVHAAFGQLQREMAEAGKASGVELSIANALWAQQGHPFLPAFLDIDRSDYQANVAQADFRTAPEAARGKINHWVAQKTRGKIEQILPPGSLNALTRLVLANAVYFKGVWAKPYEKAETTPQPFHFTRTRQAHVPVMHHFDDVRYMDNKDYQAVELPYRGERLSMVILLPRQVDGCHQLEDRLSPAVLSGALRQMKQREVEIFLPRFKLESSFKLNDTLAAMGMPNAFGARADFTGMDGGAGALFISDVFHKAWGEVNEEGTEAAAATVVGVAASAAPMNPPPPPPVFRADHPFIFLIRDRQSGSLLFLGRLADPGH